MAEAAQKQVLASVKGFLKSGAYSDLTITCGSDTYKVHKVVVCERASFFARALKFGGQETQNGTIDLPQDGPVIVKLLMQYLYEGEYDPILPDTDSQGGIGSTTAKAPLPRTDPDGNHYSYSFPHTCKRQRKMCTVPYICPHHTCKLDTLVFDFGTSECGHRCNMFNCNICNPLTPPVPSLNGTSEQLLTHAKMYEIADKYDVVGLKDLVKEKFGRACQNFWDDAIFANAAHYAFSTTSDHDKGLRDIVPKTVAGHMKALVKKPEIEALLTEFNGLAYGLLKVKTDAGWE